MARCGASESCALVEAPKDVSCGGAVIVSLCEAGEDIDGKDASPPVGELSMTDDKASSLAPSSDGLFMANDIEVSEMR